MTVLPLPPGSAPADAAERAIAHFRRLTGRVAAAAARVHLEDDREAVHDLRVAARRLEVALQVWRSVLARRPRRRARRLTRRLRREAGPAREAEVHAARLTECGAQVIEAHRPAIESELARLGERVTRTRRRLAERLPERRIARLWRWVERAMRGLDAPDAGVGVRPVAARRRRALRALLAARPTLDDAPLHQARVAVKKWRYAEESLAAGLGGEAPPSTRRLRSVQSELGRIHDRATLRDHVRRAAARAERRGEAEHAAVLTALSANLEADRVEQVLRFRTASRALEPSGD